MIAGSEASVGQCLSERTRMETPRPAPMPSASAAKAQDHRLDQELAEDVIGAGAHGHPQADLPRPLGHRDQHDVHDAHAAHDQ